MTTNEIRRRLNEASNEYNSTFYYMKQLAVKVSSESLMRAVASRWALSYDNLNDLVIGFKTLDEAVDAEYSLLNKEDETSPVMKQYRDLKAKHPDAVLLFRCGDFYETYEDDARVCAEVLGIILTYGGNNHTIGMAGFPYHALDTYLPKLIRAGHRVAICDQIEDPNKVKHTAKRGITAKVEPSKKEKINQLEELEK